MTKIKVFMPFVLIIVLATLIRFYRLGNVPPSPDWDEAALGYNAYSILKTGRDEFGSFMPLVFRSFNDYKPPLYVYLTIPSVAFFGLNVWSVRLVSAVFGVMAVIGTYFLTAELTKLFYLRFNQLVLWKQPKNTQGYSFFQRFISISAIPYYSAFLLAISPWHVQFSRIGFEANIAVTLNIWGTVFFFWGLRNAKFFIFSALLFVLGLYSYHTERVFLPLYVLLLYSIFFKQKYFNKKALFVTVSLVILLCIPIIYSFIQSNAFQRFNSTSVFRKQTEYLSLSVEKYNWDIQRRSILGKVLNDRRLEWAKIIISGYLSHYSLNWLFITGDSPRHHAPDNGLMYIFSIPFLCAGIITVFNLKRFAFYIFGWLLLSPIASSLTFEVPHAVRSIVFLPVYEIIISIGIWIVFVYVAYIYLNSSIIHKFAFLILMLCFVCTAFFEVIRYTTLYYNFTNYEYSSYWQSGYEEAVKYVQEHESKYDHIVVSTDLEQPYIFFLFFTQYSPKSYLTQGGSNNQRFGKYIFRRIDWQSEIIDGKTLFVDTVKNISRPNIKTITSVNGQPVIALAD